MSGPYAGVNADVWVSATPSIALGSPESCTDSGDHINYTASVHQYWDDTQTFTVQCSPDGSTSWTTVTDYTMQWVLGKVVFNTARVPGTNAFVRINAGSYINVTQLDYANTWTYTETQEMKPTTPFQAPSGYRVNTPTVYSVSGKIDTWRTDDRLTKELKNKLVIVLYLSRATNARWIFFGYMTNVSPEADAADVQKQPLAFVNSGPVYFLPS